MAFNIERFRSNISGFGYAKPHNFEVFVQAPPLLQNSTLNVNGRESSVNDLNNLLRFRIDQVTAPGGSIVSADIHRYGVGPTQKMPFNSQFFDTSFSVLLDKNTSLWDFWYNWVNAIFNFNGQESNGNNLITGGRLPTYSARYKEEYATTMMIVMYDTEGNTIKTINLYDAFPSSIRNVPLGWNAQNSLIRLNVSITYSQYSLVGSSIRNNNVN